MASIRQFVGSRTLVHGPRPGACVHNRVVVSTIQRTVCRVAKVEGDVTVEEELLRLRRENELLRQQLALYQQAAAPISIDTPESAVKSQAPTPAAARVETLERPTATKQAAGPEAGILWPQASGGEKFWERAPRTAPAPLDRGAVQEPPVERDANTLHVVHITAEMAPIAKVGGLGDVVTGLAKAAQARGHQVCVMLPFYECLPEEEIKGLKHEMDVEVPKGYRWDGEMRVGPLRTSVYWGLVQGCAVYLLRPADGTNCNLFRGGRIYGGSYNEMEAYLYFCRACLEYLRASNQHPNILQLHDWHAAAAAMLYWEVYNNGASYSRTRIVLTIHNMDNTGIRRKGVRKIVRECRQDEFSFTGVAGELFASIDKALDERTIGHNPERLNLMKGGIVYSNAVTTVSPTYALEVLNGGAAGWLRSTFARPEGLGLAVSPRKPLVVVVSRLVPQKGIHLIKAAIFRTLERGGQFVLLGSGHSDPVFRSLAEGQFKNHPDCRLMIMYSERLAHQIYAAADVVVVPSMFEPCGLTQMIALRYGAVPVVRRTGGLADTVFDVDGPAAAGPRNGYTFDGTDEGSMYGALDRALQLYEQQPGRWAALSCDNMRLDVSWAKSAESYVDVYRSVAAE
ncbi:hypothetical protein VOLCADRAFT_108446 [Volvox carteri f. nagariensis]|uniref:starch synthase n=1 Tax=Volvox carteri f. nagariensis TaxID=3068 RepID=D8UK57_VOLCA|nr:uncharacterized protein VOLCADRAFT_108446 [Volvox carteri f. nagariensis]EFJ39907.1 hypothetical protein VOLCADRAFT_108446 [Volvox carteri f. nagariensis]|eukprot:XP_002959046.1 hypothetical protein VOLCADRAFT_108446 [Volvox carteri f. nagariensis]